MNNKRKQMTPEEEDQAYALRRREQEEARRAEPVTRGELADALRQILRDLATLIE